MKNKTMKIQVLGSGCPTCKKLFELTKQAVEELDFKTEVEYITDIQKIVEMGVMSSPVLAINGKPVMTGSVSDIEKIKKIINDCGNDFDVAEKKSGCSCGGNY
ncbi:MAG: thioredoxin family protein [Parcubacteria group bacterium CG10_big_fil_rev_8_21_14_0_10_36_14]|nr:MAG: thioredoxin family protein [Parcubacteria group bacterium CG10_big_fil_rev_8_21_14_0_10_36_14]